MVDKILVIAVAAAVALASSQTLVADEPVKPVGLVALSRCSDAELGIGGPVGESMQLVSTNWLIRAPRDNPAIFSMFADRDTRPHADLLPWSGEFAGKHLTSLVQVLRVSGDPLLKAATSQFVEKLLPLQAEDGYLGPFPRDARLTGKAPNCKGPTWDLWAHYHIMMGLLLWYDETGDAKSLAAARRIGDLLCEKFLNSKRPVSSTGSTEMNQAVVHSLACLYARTGEKKYLELAEEVVADFATPGSGDYFRKGLQGVDFYQLPKPRWESLHPIMGLAELYRLTGNEDYRKAFENLWWSIVETDRHNNGGFSSGEQAQGNPYHRGAIETCCTIAWMAMSVEMLQLTGDSRVADELELSTLNQVVGSYSPDGRWSTYNTPMDGRRIASTDDIAFQIRPGSEELNCCSVNAARGYGLLSEWALMKDDAGLVLNWYGPAEMKTRVGETPVVLRQETDYPTDGQIQLKVEPESAVEFELKLRIPHWSKDTKVSVNGEAQSPQPGKYLAIKRRWQPGDVVKIDLDMSLRFWGGERECKGKTSIYRGPLLLVLEGPAGSTPEFEKEWERHGSLRSTRTEGARARYTFEGDTIEWHGHLFDDAGKALVLIDDREVDVVDQYGPRRGAPFVWKRSGLGPGKHTLMVEALGEKSTQSKDVWINVTKFEAPFELPKLRAAQLSKAQISSPRGTILTLDVPRPDGGHVRLRDFATAGHAANYYSWLDVEGVAPAAFTRENPSRTVKASE